MLDRGIYFAPSQFEAGFLSTAHRAARRRPDARRGRRRADGGSCRSAGKPLGRADWSASGLSHNTAPVDVRERHAFPAHKMGEALIALRDYEAVREALMLQTCGRLEIYAELEDYEEGVEQIRQLPRQLPPRQRRGHGLLHVHAARESGHRPSASREHRARLDADRRSRDSRAGEGSVRSRRSARSSLGKTCTTLFREAINAGKAARTQTDIGGSVGLDRDRGGAIARIAARRRPARHVGRRGRGRQDGLAGRAPAQARRLP